MLEVSEQRWGSLTSIRLPSGASLGLYQPKPPDGDWGEVMPCESPSPTSRSGDAIIRTHLFGARCE